MIKANNTQRKSWIKYNNDSDFPIQNIPFGVFQTKKHKHAQIGTIIGETVISLTEMEKDGFFNLIIEENNLSSGFFSQSINLNNFLKLGKKIWRDVRDEIALIFDEKNKNAEKKLNKHFGERFLYNQDDVEMLMPCAIGDYTDFYSSKDHAMNVGKMFRDPENALLPNWSHIPVGYHGRASSIVVSGTKIKRPHGQIIPKGEQNPIFGLSKLLDFELEIGFITGEGKSLGQSISTEEAEDYIFGLCLFNDWSARDIQKFEYIPLGPFLGKSFASSISPWIVTLDALDSFRVPGEKQIPIVQDYLKYNGLKNYNIDLEVILETSKGSQTKISKSNFRYMYWNMCQQLAHHTINGCNIRAGDLLASGTISGPEAHQYGSMLELSWGGTKEVKLNNGEIRKFLLNNDTIIMKAVSKYSEHNIRIGFGEVKNKIIQ